jgi:hypothetical protein
MTFRIVAGLRESVLRREMVLEATGSPVWIYASTIEFSTSTVRDVTVARLGIEPCLVYSLIVF